jgi:hypothetical protein
VFVVVSGAERRLGQLTVRGLEGSGTPVCSKTLVTVDGEAVCDVCHMATGVVAGRTFLVAITPERVLVLENVAAAKTAAAGSFGAEPMLKADGWVRHSESSMVAKNSTGPGGTLKNSVGLLTFSAAAGKFIWGDRTFWAMEPTAKKAGVLLRRDSWSAVYLGASSSLYAMEALEVDGELLLCFNEFGVFAAHDGGQGTRPGQQLRWSHKPTAFARFADCLYVASIATVELIDLRMGTRTASRIVTVPGSRLLFGGPQGVLFSSSSEGRVELLNMEFRDPTDRGCTAAEEQEGEGRHGAATAAAAAAALEAVVLVETPAAALLAKFTEDNPVDLSSPFRALSVDSAC